MKIKIESTEKLVTLNDVPARVWEGISEGGVHVTCFITRIAISENESEEMQEIFKSELEQCRKPSAAIEAIPLRLIL